MKLALTLAAKPYLLWLSIIWTSRLSDANRLKATNQFVLPVLTYPMWTQQWPLGELQSTDRETRKLIVRMVGDTLSSTAVLDLPRDKGGRGLKSVEQENKLIKFEAVIKLYENPNPTMRSVRMFEERACGEKGFSVLVQDAHKFGEKLGTTLNLATPDPGHRVARSKSQRRESVDIR